ncbi:MAG: hypothetical protein D6710_12330, partial [Nitrospirae bacterium]
RLFLILQFHIVPLRKWNYVELQNISPTLSISDVSDLMSQGILKELAMETKLSKGFATSLSSLIYSLQAPFIVEDKNTLSILWA